MSAISGNTESQQVALWSESQAANIEPAQPTQENLSAGLSPETLAFTRTVVVNSIKVAIAGAGAGIKIVAQGTAGGPFINASVDVVVPGSIASTEEAITEDCIDSTVRKSSEAFQAALDKTTESSLALLPSYPSCCLI